jgi:hypothetical protein
MELGQVESAGFYLEKAITSKIALKRKTEVDPIFSQLVR